MKTVMTLDGISDGRFYTVRDVVKADANGCNDCSACCHGVSELVSLTPYDFFEIKNALNTESDTFLNQYTVWHIAHKLYIPHLKSIGKSEKCIFLDTLGRCSIHMHRPDICRLFPLGRVYEAADFKYILQVDACLKPKLEKVKIKKWLGIEHYAENKAMHISWYQFIKAIQFRLKFVRDEDELRAINDAFKQLFYNIDADTRHVFYEVFQVQLKIAKEKFGVI